MKRNSLRLALAVLLILALAGQPVVCALTDRAVDPDRTGSIEMRSSYEGKPVSGGDLALYRVAELEEENGSYYFRLRAELGGQRLDQASLDDPDLTQRLAADPNLGIAEKTAVFDKDGLVRFSRLRPGLYLLMQQNAAEGFDRMLPVLISLPWYDEQADAYLYEIDASVKPAPECAPQDKPVIPPRPTDHLLPQTGQRNWPIPVLAGLGTLFLLLGLALLSGDRTKREATE